MNHNTTRVFTFIACDGNLMEMARKHESYKSFTDELIDLQIVNTDDNVSLSDRNLDFDFLDKFIECLR